MTDEELKEVMAKADTEYDMLKDKVHEQYDEIQRLKENIEVYNFTIRVQQQQINELIQKLDGGEKK